MFDLPEAFHWPLGEAYHTTQEGLRRHRGNSFSARTSNFLCLKSKPFRRVLNHSQGSVEVHNCHRQCLVEDFPIPMSTSHGRQRHDVYIAVPEAEMCVKCILYASNECGYDGSGYHATPICSEKSRMKQERPRKVEECNFDTGGAGDRTTVCHRDTRVELSHTCRA